MREFTNQKDFDSFVEQVNAEQDSGQFAMLSGWSMIEFYAGIENGKTVYIITVWGGLSAHTMFDLKHNCNTDNMRFEYARAYDSYDEAIAHYIDRIATACNECADLAQ